MKRLCVGFAVLVLAAGCASGGTGSTTAAPAASQNAKSRISMSFVPAASAKKVVISIDGQSSPAIPILNQAQTTTLPGNLAVSIDCQTTSGGSTSGSSANSGSGETCTVLALLPPGQHDISVAQLDFLNTLISDLNEFITLAAGSEFFGDFFNSSPTPLVTASPIPLPNASNGT
jgi:hypothetical protein